MEGAARLHFVLAETYFPRDSGLSAGYARQGTPRTWRSRMSWPRLCWRKQLLTEVRLQDGTCSQAGGPPQAPGQPTPLTQPPLPCSCSARPPGHESTWTWGLCLSAVLLILLAVLCAHSALPMSMGLWSLRQRACTAFPRGWWWSSPRPCPRPWFNHSRFLCSACDVASHVEKRRQGFCEASSAVRTPTRTSLQLFCRSGPPSLWFAA